MPLRFHSRSDDSDWLPNKNKSLGFNVKLVWISWKSDPFNVAPISCTHHLPLLKSLGQRDWAVKQLLHLSIKTAPFQAALCCWAGKFPPRYRLWAHSGAHSYMFWEHRKQGIGKRSHVKVNKNTAFFCHWGKTNDYRQMKPFRDAGEHWEGADLFGHVGGRVARRRNSSPPSHIFPTGNPQGRSDVLGLLQTSSTLQPKQFLLSWWIQSNSLQEKRRK